MSGPTADSPVDRRSIMFACLGLALWLAGCAASGGRVTDFPEQPVPQRRGTHGNGAGRR